MSSNYFTDTYTHVYYNRRVANRSTLYVKLHLFLKIYLLKHRKSCGFKNNIQFSSIIITML